MDLLDSPRILVLLLLPVSFLAVKTILRGTSIHKTPPPLNEAIPYVSNTWQFITNKQKFIDRVREALKSSPVVTCWLGPLKIYFVTGGDNVSVIFRSSFTSEPWINRIQRHAAGYSLSDLRKFAEDESGGANAPRKGNDHPPPSPETRIWHAMHRMNENGLMNEASVTTFARTYQAFFNEHVLEFPVGKWTEDVHIFAFFRQSMTASATQAMLGRRILDLFPNLVEAFWGFEQYGETLAFGVADWLDRRAIAARDRFCDMCLKWFLIARQEYRRDGVVDTVQTGEWEPVLGSEMSRGHLQWIERFDFSDRTIGGIFALFSFGLHANTIPIGTWMLMEIISDPDLYRAVQEEMFPAILHGQTCSEFLDYTKLASLPLLQSIYTEVLRLHVQILVTRTSIEPVNIAGYEVPTGSTFQAPTAVPHLDEETWGTPEHPAHKFWAYRHVEMQADPNSTDPSLKKLSFLLQGKRGSFFPYGGGFHMCSGRKYAKCEILTSVAMIVSRFEVQFVDWINADGTRSQRPAIDSTGNAVASHPDRDMKVRWRRLW